MGVTVIYVAIALFGLVALRQIAVDLLPSVDVPQVTITTRYEGVAPQEMETLVTRPIEQAVSTVEGVERIRGVSSDSLSRVELQFAWGTRLDEALDEVRVALDRTQRALPEDADTPSIHKFDLAAIPVAFLGVTGGGDPRRLKQLAEQDIGRAFERLPGVASVDVNGGLDREIRVALDSERLEALSVSADQVAAALARENRTLSAGQMRDSGREVVVRTEGEFRTVEEIEDVVVTTRNGQPIRVRDLARIDDTVREIRSELYVDGKPGIRMRIYKQSGANTVDVSRRVQEEIEALNARYAGQVELAVIWDASDFIRAAVTNVQESAGFGGLLAVVVLVIFLRDLRSTLVVAAAIPLSIVATFALMHFEGMTLNIISFGGIALGVGMLVDGAIVILESIHRKREEGLGPAAAAIEGASEVGSAVVAGTLTTVAVFAPVVFVGGFAGVFFGEMALVVTFALLCSLAVALTLVPMLAARMTGRDATARPSRLARASSVVMTRAEGAYVRLLENVLAAPWAVVMAAGALLISGAAISQRIDSELMPEADEGRIDIDVELAVGTPLEETSAVMRAIEAKVLATLRPGELEHTMTSVGPEAWWRPGGSHEGEVDLTMVPVDQRARSSDEVVTAIQRALADVPGAKVRVRHRSSNPLARVIRGGDDRLSVEIRGHDLEVADAIGAQVADTMRSIDGVSFARPDREQGQVERVLRVDRARAAELGLGSAEIAEAVEHYLLGRVATRLRDRGDEYDIRVQLGAGDRRHLAQLGKLPIVTPGGQQVPLETLISVEEGRSPSSIARLDQERVLRVDAGVAGRSVDDVVADLRPALAAIAPPEGFEIDLAGEIGERDETFGSLLAGILLACFLVYAVMAVQFESARQPLVVMVTVPFALVGVVLALLVTRTTLNMNSFLGAIVLVGIVVNNAIVLIDAANTFRGRGCSVVEAIVEAGRRRLRPIAMTTLTTALGLVPLAVGVGEGSEIQAPLARAVIGGLLTSTLVTLVLVPCAYLLVERGGRRVFVAQPAE